MKRSIAAFASLILISFAAKVWSGPAEEVAQVAGPRLQAFQEGNLDAFVAAYADNAVFHSALVPYRVEGKDAIRAYFVDLFQTYPKRRVLVRQPSIRAYNDDLVIQNVYFVLNFSDQRGETKTIPVQQSVTWAKIGGRWQIVDQHGSRPPVAP